MDCQLYNGDCIKIMHQLISLGYKVDAIIVDPPYGTTACAWDEIIPIEEMWDCIKKIRKEKQFTQEQIIKLCKALNCSADYLLGLED